MPLESLIALMGSTTPLGGAAAPLGGATPLGGAAPSAEANDAVGSKLSELPSCTIEMHV